MPGILQLELIYMQGVPHDCLSERDRVKPVEVNKAKTPSPFPTSISVNSAPRSGSHKLSVAISGPLLIVIFHSGTIQFHQK